MIIHNAKELAMAVKHYRKKQQLMQTEISDIVGLKQSTVSAFENNPDSTKIETLFRILSATNLIIHISPKEEAGEKSDWSEAW